MKLDFRIDFGYQYLYSRKHYHPTFIWDGGLFCDGGKIEKTYKLDYPYIWFGPGQSPKETELPNPEWQFKTKREFTGVRFVTDVSENTVFRLHTVSADVAFSAKDLEEQGRLEFPVGPKYLGCYITVTKKDYLWFRRPLRENETEFSCFELGLPVHNFARMNLAWLSPQETVKVEYDVPTPKSEHSELLFHIVAMGAPEFSGGEEIQVKGYIPLEIYCDGVLLSSFKQFFRHHDEFLQILEDVFARVEAPIGKHTFEIKNVGEEISLAISRITVKPCEYVHGQVSIPEWALAGERLVGAVYAAFPDKIALSGIGISLECQRGWNEFEFSFATPGICEISSPASSAKIEVFDVVEEKNPVKVGFDLTTVPHDDTGYMDWILNYAARTRLGNYVVFRNFNGPVDPKEWKRYALTCKKYGIYVASCTETSYPDLVKYSGEMFHDAGSHEYTKIVYARDPLHKKASPSETMREAYEKLIEYNKVKIDEIHKVAPTAAFGDPSGSARHSFLAGADFVRAETMVPHTMTLLSQVRAAAEALGQGRWGVHIAIQHPYQPYRENHLGQYFLSLMQPWIMGAEVIYEEDSLFNLFKEERQAWDDLLTGGKRDMTRSFFKFAKTHARRGVNVRNIAYLEGRYSAPFNGFICSTEQDPHYSVYGGFGNTSSCWGHAQPEKARQLLDVLMPGANTHPLRQKFDKRRFFFSGTPYGDFDCTPIEAPVDYLKKYKLILNLGWNTAIDEDLEKLTEYVKAGGVLFTGLPEFSRHIRREFLYDMEELDLISNEQLSKICGITVNGRGERYLGYWNSKDREEVSEPELSSLPSDSPDEDGELYLADITLTGAEVVAWDYYTGKPMLVKYALGSGFVYTITAWAYPGHEKLQAFSAAWIKKLSEETLDCVRVIDPSREVFWSVWQDGDTKTVMLLNTDWTTHGNEKSVEVIVGSQKIDLKIKERRITILEIENSTLKATEAEL